MRLQKVIRFVGQLLLMAALAQVALAQNGSLNGFDDYVKKAMKEWQVPGVAIAIVKGDQILLAKGYGVRKIGEPIAVDERTLFAIGSSSKAFTAASIAILVDQGKVKPPRDWSAELLKTTKTLEQQAKAAEKKQESERTTGTKPSVPLDKYAGTYRNDLYGDVKISHSDAKLNLRFGPAFTADLEHWHYDTFRARFVAAGDAKALVTFALNAQGKVDTLVLGMPGMADYPFKRAAESKPEGGK